MYEHVLVPLDGSTAAERVLPHMEALAKAFRSKVTLVRAIVSAETLLAETAGTGTGVGEMAPVIDPEPIVEIDREAAEEYLNGIANKLRADGLTVDTEHPEGDAATEIVERARARGVSLIMMTTHGRSGLGRVIFGSVADAVLRHADCPVMLVRVKNDDTTSPRGD